MYTHYLKIITDQRWTNYSRTTDGVLDFIVTCMSEKVDTKNGTGQLLKNPSKLLSKQLLFRFQKLQKYWFQKKNELPSLPPRLLKMIRISTNGAK